MFAQGSMFKRGTTVRMVMPREAIFGWKGHVVILIVLQVVLGTVYLSTVPHFYVDEAWDSSLGYNLAYSGTLRHPFVEGFGGMHIHFVQNRVVVPLVCGVIFKVAGYSIVASRIGSLIFGLAAVLSLYVVMCRWFSEEQAFWMVLATMIQPWFFEVGRRARPEIYCTALGLVFLWLLIRFFDSRSRGTAFFIGVLAGVSGLTHPNGLILIFAISCAVVFWLEVRSIGRLVQWASFGLVLVILPYVIYVFWAIQDPKVSFAEQMQISTLHRSILGNEILRWKNFFKPIEFPIVSTGT